MLRTSFAKARERYRKRKAYSASPARASMLGDSLVKAREQFRKRKPRSPSTVQAVRETAIISTEKDDGLCDRCRGLNLESYLSRNHIWAVDITTIGRESLLRGDCSLCSQFASFFHIFFDNIGRSSQADEMRFGYQYSPTSPPFGSLYLSGSPGSTFSSDAKFLIPAHRGNARAGTSPSVTPGRIVHADYPDFSLAQQWLHFCQANHLTSCGQVPTQAVSPLKVIDCQTTQLCFAPPGSSYATLSYVWGNSTSEDFPIEGRLPDRLPKTVEDAIAVTLALGLKYLWIDRYCIDQTRPEEKHQLVRNMDKIYRCSELTIIASAGDDPYHGLPGIRNTPRVSQPTLTIGSLTFASVEKPELQIRQSKWNSRGWTYQEALLSRRRLVFTESQMYFQCMDMCCLETLNFDPASDLAPCYSVFPDSGIGSDIEDLYERLGEYYQKRLSFDTDTLNAFVGVFNAFRELETANGQVNHFYGIPYISDPRTPGTIEVISFAMGLLWWVRGSCFRYNPRSRQKYPSWSWAASKVKLLAKPTDELVMETNWIYRMPMNWADASFRITHLSGEVMDLVTHASRRRDYQAFRPSIAFTGWSIWSHVYGGKSYEPFRFLGVQNECVRFDDSGSWSGQKLLALCLVAQGISGDSNLLNSFEVKCLLVAETSPKIFRRVGLWSVQEAKPRPPVKIDQILDSLLESKAGEGNNRWERRTIVL